MKVRIKRLTTTAKKPTKKHNSAGFDVYSDEDVVLYPKDLKLVGTGISSAFTGGVILLKERSGLATEGIEVHGGVIDPDYRGEWKVLLKNNGPTTKVRKGDRIAQAVVLEQPTIFMDEVEELDTTERGFKGFGSTGK